MDFDEALEMKEIENTTNRHPGTAANSERSSIYKTLLVLLMIGCGLACQQSLADDSKMALAQLLRDIDQLQPQLAAQLDSTKEGYYTIRRGETLDQIIDRVMPHTALRKSIVRSAIVAANPHAFRRNNPHWMYADKRIVLPDSEAIKAVIFKPPAAQSSALTMTENPKQWIRYP
jgi:hypothetical protein